MNEEGKGPPEPIAGTTGTGPSPSGAATDVPQALVRPDALEVPTAPDPVGAGVSPGRLPLLPGFREMALRRMAQDRGRLMKELAARRQDAGLSQTEIAARMGTSQSAVARLESGEADVRASTLERYAAALGTEITWKLQG
jgi:DNA-binding Xre family transcriptional regulator